MSYTRFALMILTSTVVMFILMYLNTYAWEHIFFSETRVYMAILMGATMAIIMLSYMLPMYANTSVNLAIFIGAALVFALSLWLVRSQITVSGESYIRAMIPHHSIAVLTSERAQIRDARVRKLADEIIEAQRREIAEMRYLVSEVNEGNYVESVYEDPAPEVGTVQQALDNLLISRLDAAPLAEAEAQEVLEAAPSCRFNRSPEAEPILWTSGQDGPGVMKLNGVIIPLEAAADQQTQTPSWRADGLTMQVEERGKEADWRYNARLEFRLKQGLTVGYGGFWSCEGAAG
jgi:hypothetical protein